MNDKPTVSVIIPVYNGEQFLAEAIQSALDQTLPPDEIIVVDDGSTDGSGAVAAAYPVRLLCKAHSGLAATLNHGVRQATGDWLAFLDADDRWLPHKLALQMAAFQRDPALAMVFGHCRQFAMRGSDCHQEEVALQAQPGISKSALLVRRAAFLQVGYFAEDADKHDFLEWYARSLELKLRAVIVTEVLYERRIHDRNMGQTSRDAQHRQYLHVLRNLVARRRTDAAP